ncbi:response regulator [Pikeienuella sp. HZG-20]|uniref:response regulator n=1 Tax=Paludibacillus litoralis TaxID=3133267 RepID=UPI0030EB222C
MPASAEDELERLDGMTILLAEDNVVNQMVAAQMLETLGAEVDIAADGVIALDRLKGRSYDVLLIDIEMPRVSGLDVIRSIRAGEEPLASAPVIALTAYAMQEHREKIMQVGADGVITKPITTIKQFGLDILSIMDLRAAGGAGRKPSAPGAAVIDLTIYESLAASIGAGGMVELLKRVEIDLSSVKADIAAAVDAGDTHEMLRASHILISVAGSIGAVRLQRLAENLNRLAENDDADAMADPAGQAGVELDRVLDFVAAARRDAAP